LDLSLFAEGDTINDVRAQIESQVVSYMSYIIEKGVEEEMFPRRAPARYWLKYLGIKIANRGNAKKPGYLTNAEINQGDEF